MIRGYLRSPTFLVIEGRIYKGSFNMSIGAGYITLLNSTEILFELKFCELRTDKPAYLHLTSAHLEELLDIIELLKACKTMITGSPHSPGVMNDTVTSLKKASEDNIQCSEIPKKDLH